MRARVKTAAWFIAATILLNLISNFLGGWLDIEKLANSIVLPGWLVAVWQAVTGPFGWGFAMGAFIFGFWGAWSVLNQNAQEERAYNNAKRDLRKLRAEGVALRNKLLVPIENYDDNQERTKLGDWSRRVVERLEVLGLPEEQISWFETLGNLAPLMPVGNHVRDQAQIETTTIYNEKISFRAP